MAGIGPILLCGCGSIGKRHLLNLAALGAKVTAIYDPSLSAIPDGPWSKMRSFEELTEQAKSVLTIVASPTKEHVPHARLLLEAGARAVLVEKPLGVNHTEAKQLKPWAKRIAVAFNYRFLGPLYDSLDRCIQDNGQKLVIISATDDISKWPS